MTDRILDLSDGPAVLKARNRLLVLQRQGADELTLPFADLAVLVAAHPQVSFTHAVLSGLAEAGAAFVACGKSRMPVAMLLPLAGHSLQAERFTQQARASLPTHKRLWKQIVRAKLRAQSLLLNDLHSDDEGISEMVSQVRSGDPTNVEAQASRRYWRALFADEEFRRRRDGEDCNRLLNYGYAVLRAIVARAVCAAGLHPSLGIHHHNRYDAFCLADDLMEPLRPLVDGAVVRWVGDHGSDAPLDRQAKAAILQALTRRFAVDGESRTLFDVMARTASNLAAVFAGDRKELLLPEM